MVVELSRTKLRFTTPRTASREEPRCGFTVALGVIRRLVTESENQIGIKLYERSKRGILYGQRPLPLKFASLPITISHREIPNVFTVPRAGARVCARFTRRAS